MAAEAAVQAAQANKAQQIVHTFDKKVEEALTAIEARIGSEVYRRTEAFLRYQTV